MKREAAGRVSWTVSELYTAHFGDLEAKGRRKFTIRDKETRLGSFLKLHGDSKISELGPADILAWLEATGSTGRNRRNYETAVQSLFNWAEKCAPGEFRNTIARFPHQRKPEVEPAAIVTPKTARDVLHQLEKDGWTREALSLAICLFAGLRTSEVVGSSKDANNRTEGGLRWKHIDFDDCEIKIPAALSKTCDRREVSISPNLMKWLLRYRIESGRIGPANNRFRDRINAALKAMSRGAKTAGPNLKIF